MTFIQKLTEQLCCTTNLAEYNKMLQTFLELHSKYHKCKYLDKMQTNDSVFYFV